MTAFDLAVAIAIVVAAVFGVRSSIRLVIRYRHVSPVLRDWRDRLLLATFATVAVTITLVALWIGVLTVRRLSGLPPIDGTAPITGLLAVVILLIPTGLDLVVSRIARR